MNHLVIEILKSFEPSRRRTTEWKYNEFLAHIFMVYDKRISLCRSEQIRNKYIKERNSILEYVAKNKKSILNQLVK
jgi:hypothetical protein|tara:strand:+ start:1321 stop:1548 length:228 start_codon:yes stop_codon:yes gene_type:complete